MTKEKEEEFSRLAISKAYDVYPISKTNISNNEWNAKRVGYYQGYKQALKDKSIERSEFDNDMMNAIICLTKQGRHLEEEHINWIKNFINKFHNE